MRVPGNWVSDFLSGIMACHDSHINSLKNCTNVKILTIRKTTHTTYLRVWMKIQDLLSINCIITIILKFDNSGT